MKAFNIIAISVFVGAVGFISYSLIKDSNRKYYATTQAETCTVENKIYLSGFVYPSKEIEVKPQTSGIVNSIYVNVGDTVKEGDPIAAISLVPNSSEVEQLTNAVKIAEINRSSAGVIYERQKQLYEKKAISKSDFELAEKEYLTATENYSTAEKQLNLRKQGTRSSNNIVRSSTAGVIIDIPIKVGSSVMERSNYNAGSTVAIIAGTDHYIFKANVPEKHIGYLTVGTPIKLSLLAFEEGIIESLIAKISAKGEMTGGAVKFPIEATFVANDSEITLRSGYSATGEIILSYAEDALTLPERCINFKGDTAYVYVTDSLKRSVMEKIVSLGISDGERVQVVDGISERDLIITNYHD